MLISGVLLSKLPAQILLMVIWCKNRGTYPWKFGGGDLIDKSHSDECRTEPEYVLLLLCRHGSKKFRLRFCK